jgi:hypothetical protein
MGVVQFGGKKRSKHPERSATESKEACGASFGSPRRILRLHCVPLRMLFAPNVNYTPLQSRGEFNRVASRENVTEIES